LDDLKPQLISTRFRFGAILITASVVAFLLFAVLYPERIYLRRVPMTDIAFRVPGEPVTRSLSQFPGRVLVVTLFRSGCMDCLTQLGTLDTLAKAYGREGVMAVALTDNPMDIHENVTLKSMSILAGYLPDVQAAALPKDRPHTWVIDRQSRQVFEASGRLASEEKLGRIVTQLLNN